MTKAKLLVGLAFSALLALAGCDNGSGQPQARPPAPVTVAPPLVRDMADYDEFTGRFAAVDSVEIRARVSGYLDSIHFKDGQEVSKGQLLYVIDPRPFEAEVARAKADVDAADAQLELAEREVARYGALRQGGNASQQTLDEKLQARRSASASVQSAQAALRQAELNLEFTSITAPVAGRISRTNVTVGNLVSGADAGGTALTTIVSVDPIYLYFDGDEQVYLRSQRRNLLGELPDPRITAIPIDLALADETGFPHAGWMDFVDNQLDQATGTIRVRGIFANPGRVFTPGMFARVRVAGSEPKRTILIPDAAIGTDQTRRFVWVIGAENKPQLTIVELGSAVGSLRVVRSGLTPTDQVVVNGIMRVRPGVPVSPIPAHLDDDGKIVNDPTPVADAKPEGAK
ncbi:efflux RND transporter periplasmic adaptor subunit [Oleomonas cavernae]|uniref:Efflux RND transporter periplasmic adaptor subunit n=1 Tax=Oleomonas cavernae TaxID=2320859 RepID=A0A418W9C4_9PROT|nr:efflux RND transporter periplasmic adaptor subunit [Oleomonas cavernae]RJF86622.1 efflux RND transporter periplasmic adaptor subunit [Oleomonas cavernae]